MSARYIERLSALFPPGSLDIENGQSRSKGWGCSKAALASDSDFVTAASAGRCGRLASGAESTPPLTTASTWIRRDASVRGLQRKTRSGVKGE